MKINRRWLAIAPLVVAAVLAVVTASAGGASDQARRLRLDHRLGRRRPAAGGEGLRQGAPQGQGQDRHLRRRRQWRDHAAGEDPALEPHRQRLAGCDLQRAGQRPGLDGIQAVRLRGAGQGPHPGEGPQEVARAVARPVHRQRQGDLRPGQPRPDGALVRQDADGQVRLHRPDDVAGVGGARRRRSPPSTPATSSGTPATRTAPGPTCGPTSARSARCRRTAASASTRRIRTAPAWPACSIR